LSHLGRQAVLIDGLGAMHGEQLQLLGEQDAIIAASFPKKLRRELVSAKFSITERDPPLYRVG